MNKKSKKWARVIFGIIILAMGFGSFQLYRAFFAPIVDAKQAETPFYVQSGSTAQVVVEGLSELGLVANTQLTYLLMQQKNYTGQNVEPGMYIFKEGMSLNAVVNHLRGGHGEEMVKIVFHTAPTLNELAGKAARNIEADSATIAQLLLAPGTYQKFGFERHTFLSMFLPDTYFSEWDTDANAFVERMAAEYKKFWDEDRKAMAKALGMSQSEVATLASIVQAEQQAHPEERPAIAGLYMNRLRKGMKLQSDPTVVYAVGDFNINRVLRVHLLYDSPYNTYLYTGLPPGPINVPQKSSIDAVLNYEKNNYIFMCARADFSGYHDFATNLDEHNRNAAAYRKALNEKKIYR